MNAEKYCPYPLENTLKRERIELLFPTKGPAVGIFSKAESI
jgi:hypothetical protein